MFECHPNLLVVRRFMATACLLVLAACSNKADDSAAAPLAAASVTTTPATAPAVVSPTPTNPTISTALAVPAAPAGLSATAGNAQVALSWSASSGATSYGVKRSTTGGGGSFTQVATTTSTSYSDNMVTNDTTYYYVVSAANSAGESAHSTQAYAAPANPQAKVVMGCNGLAPVGVWEQITPAGVDLSTFGVISVSVAPNNTAIVYAGTSKSGLYKSEDCGAHFTKVNVGSLSAEMSNGSMNALIDPVNPNVIYTSSLYGLNGFFKSTNGGKDFVSIFTSQISNYAPYGGFVGGYDMDPDNHLHLLVGFHAECSIPDNKACYAETLDGGVTWVMRKGDPSWSGGEGVALTFLDGNRWLFTSESNGMWLSKDRGISWAKLPQAQVVHGQGHMVRMNDGSFFMAMANGIMRSSDGETWSLVPNSGNLLMGLATDGETLWASQAFPYNPNARPTPAQRYWKGSVSNPTSWTQMNNAPPVSSGGTWLTYDPDHHILYSANYWDGLWRVVVK